MRHDKFLKEHLKIKFPFRKPLSEQQVLQKIDNDSLFGYVQCDLSVTKHLRSYFQHFSPILKNCFANKTNVGEYMESYADQQGLLRQPSRLMISSFHLENGSLITPTFDSNKSYTSFQYNEFWFPQQLLPVKTIEGPPTTSSLILFKTSRSCSVNG